MTVEDFLQDSLTISHFYNDKYDKMCCLSSDVQKAMKEYARLKCEELLKIVVENVQIKQENEYLDSSRGYGIVSRVDEDSILNSVDLNEFIK